LEYNLLCQPFTIKIESRSKHGAKASAETQLQLEAIKVLWSWLISNQPLKE